MRFDELEERAMLHSPHEPNHADEPVHTNWLSAPTIAIAQDSGPAMGPEVQAASAPGQASIPGLPILNSKPGAPIAIYLDFEGWTGNGFGGQQSWPAYDVDGDTSNFNATEQANIAEGWKRNDHCQSNRQ